MTVAFTELEGEVTTVLISVPHTCQSLVLLCSLTSILGLAAMMAMIICLIDLRNT